MKKRRTRKRVKISLIVVLLCVLSAILGFYIQRRQNFVNIPVKVVYKTVNTEVVDKASIVMVGDALMHMGVNYAYKTSKSRLDNQSILLPINEIGDPDYLFMEAYMKELEKSYGPTPPEVDYALDVLSKYLNKIL